MQEHLAKETPSIQQAGGPFSLVDDDAAVRRSLTRWLRSAGGGAEAFASAGASWNGPPAPERGCVLLDVQMPAYERS